MVDSSIRRIAAKGFVAAIVAAVVAGPAVAERIFFDDFNAEAGGGTAIFQQSLIHWDITGYVDVIGTANQLGYTVDSTVIDLGGGLIGGFMKSKQSFSYEAGKLVTLSWDMSGNQIRPNGEDIPYIQFHFQQTHPERFQDVKFISGTGFYDWIDFGPWEGCDCDSVRIYDYFFAYGYGLFGDYPMTRQSISFLPVHSGSFQFELGTYSGGGYGPLIDNFAVDVTDYAAAVPEPATWTMLIAGLGLVGAAARRRRMHVASA
jgi:hypothetical protein